MLRIHYDGGTIYIHRHLICERSQEWNSLVAAHEEVIDDSLSSLDSELFDMLSNKGAWELFGRFLYGGPMWTPSEGHSAPKDIQDDFDNLVEIHYEISGDKMGDVDASDAAMDSIRELVMKESRALKGPFGELDQRMGRYTPNSPPGKFLLDFMVYEPSNAAMANWYSAWSASPHGGNLHGDLDDGLAERLSEKAEARGRSGRAYKHPDLMERCRYHSHADFEQPCYLEK